MSECQICGLIYQGKTGRRKHDSYCKKHLKACAKFDTIYTPKECMIARNKFEQALSDNEIPLGEKVSATEKFFKSYFSQSVRDSGFNLEHCSFLDYCAKLLGQKQFNDLINPFPDVHALFLERLL